MSNTTARVCRNKEKKATGNKSLNRLDECCWANLIRRIRTKAHMSYRGARVFACALTGKRNGNMSRSCLWLITLPASLSCCQSAGTIPSDILMFTQPAGPPRFDSLFVLLPCASSLIRVKVLGCAAAFGRPPLPG